MYTERGQGINYVQSDISCILRLILRAAYRRVLDGTIGKIGPIGEKVMRGIIKTPEQLAIEIMPFSSQSFGIS